MNNVKKIAKVINSLPPVKQVQLMFPKRFGLGEPIVFKKITYDSSWEGQSSAGKASWTEYNGKKKDKLNVTIDSIGYIHNENETWRFPSVILTDKETVDIINYIDKFRYLNELTEIEGLRKFNRTGTW